MKNPHIVVGPGNMCLCGMYNGGALGCSQILNSLATLNDVVETLTKDVDVQTISEIPGGVEVDPSTIPQQPA